MSNPTNTLLTDEIKSMVDGMTKELSEVDLDDTDTIFNDMKSSPVLRGLHAIVRAIYCYAHKVTPGAHAYAENKHKCKHIADGHMGCGYVVGYAIYKWFLTTYNPEIAQLDLSTGCSYGHPRDETLALQAEIVNYLREKYPNPRTTKIQDGFRKIKAYVTDVLTELVKQAQTRDLLYERNENDLPAFREIIVHKIGMRNKYGELLSIILTRDKDLMRNPPTE